MSTVARRSANTTVPAVTAVNEWGVYDPAIAGIEALLARVDPHGLRREREPQPRRRKTRSRRPSARRDTDGVGLAIAQAIERARQQSVALPAPSVTERPAPVVVRPSRPRRTVTAMWLRTGSPVCPAPPIDAVFGIFGTLRLPPAVALVQYARGCRIGTIRITGA